MNLDYMTVSQFIEKKSKLIGKIATYDILIDSMEKMIETAIDSADLIQYELDDGQMKCRAQYRSVGHLVDNIESLERQRQRYINKYNGSVVVLRSGNL